jgi:hypothetical protein
MISIASPPLLPKLPITLILRSIKKGHQQGDKAI